jgi:putative phage-type endonuclease
MFIEDRDKKCLKQKNYKDLEIAVSEFITQNEVDNALLLDPDECHGMASIIETIYKDVFCESEQKSDIIELIITMLQSQVLEDQPIYSDSDVEYFKIKLLALEKIPQPEQRSPEWHEYRNNRLTASDLWHITNWNDSKVHDILKKKCGVDQKFSPGLAILHGVKFESVATEIYEKRCNVIITEFGCIPHSFIPYFGASPDGICSSNSENKNYVGRMLEIKCPKSRVITGFIPEVYQAQIQGQLEVCDLEYCDYLECDFQMYVSKDAFLKDVFVGEDGVIDYSRTKNGMEKGAMFETYNMTKKAHAYEYCRTILSNQEDIDKWEDPFIDTIIDSDNLEHAGTTFLYLRNISIVLVPRDREWFRTNFHKIKRFWDAVEDARMNGIPEKKKKDKEPKFDMLQFTGTMANKPMEVLIDFNSTS